MSLGSIGDCLVDSSLGRDVLGVGGLTDVVCMPFPSLPLFPGVSYRCRGSAIAFRHGRLYLVWSSTRGLVG